MTRSTAARRRRLARLRLTALPTLRLAVNPTRIGAAAGDADAVSIVTGSPEPGAMSDAGDVDAPATGRKRSAPRFRGALTVSDRLSRQACRIRPGATSYVFTPQTRENSLRHC